MAKRTEPSVAAGRPREFDLDQALDQALNVFWRKGYEGASLPELTRAMGINRPSLYAAFGNKESLFRRAIDRYAEGPARHIADALEEPVVRHAVEQVLAASIELVTHPRRPRGCFLVQSALACGAEGAPARQALAQRRKAYIAALQARFQRAQAEGDLPARADPAALARFIAAVAHGMAVQAATGATREELHEVARLAMRAWPT
jgi:AcrR family transcriptional regulator